MGKPEKIIPNIVKGMLAKHFKEICFVDQAYIMDDKVSVSDKMKEVAKAAGCKLEITGYQMVTTGA